MIIRIQKKDDPWVRVYRETIDDSRLSWRAKGLLVYFLSKPDHWQIRSEDIAKHGTEGKDAVRAAMKELRDCGYAELVNTRDGREWVITEEPCAILPNMAKSQDAILPNMAKSATSKNNPKGSKNNSERKNDGESKRFTPPSLEECKEEAKEQSIPESEGEGFWNHHEARGWWMSKGVKMKEWRRAMATWASNYRKFNINKPNAKTPSNTCSHGFDTNFRGRL